MQIANLTNIRRPMIKGKAKKFCMEVGFSESIYSLPEKASEVVYVNVSDKYSLSFIAVKRCFKWLVLNTKRRLPISGFARPSHVFPSLIGKHVITTPSRGLMWMDSKYQLYSLDSIRD